MNAKIPLGFLTTLLARSKRFAPYLPFLTAIPALYGAYELYRRHKAAAPAHAGAR